LTIYNFTGTKTARIINVGERHGGTAEKGSGTSNGKEK